jgi:L,D-transpeptidase catalytic domain
VKRAFPIRLFVLILIFFVLTYGVICYKGLWSNCKVCFLFQSCEPDVAGKPSRIDRIVTVDKTKILPKIHAKAQELKTYAAARKMNARIGFLLNMGQHSGQNRFYVYDLQKNAILDSGLVAHGSGHQLFAATPMFSNEVGSQLSSLGKYRIGAKYKGRFGDAYKLHGLETTNSNAFARTVVLHSYDCVANFETYPLYACNSWGCPMVHSDFMAKLSKIIDKEKTPIVLWVFA